MVTVAAGMWLAIVATIRQFRPIIGNLALLLLGPYLLWVSYASALTFWIWRHNPTRPSRVRTTMG
jgi:tryptophan-rich sensory protein